MTKDNLKKQAYIGVFWSSVERFSAQGLEFFIIIVLARILAPADFGILGMVAVFVAVSMTFVESGFGRALIQKQDTDRVDESTVFYFNIFIGALFALLLFFSAPWIANFYEQPILTDITKVLALVLFINSFSIVPVNLLTKKLDFKSQFKVTFLGKLLSGILAISLAFSGFGVWAFVFQRLFVSLWNAINYWRVSKWRPLLIFSYKSLKLMFNFGGNLLATSLINTISENIYNLIIGKQYTAADLGFYQNGKKIPLLPSQVLTSTVGRVIFPIFSKIQNNPEKMRVAFKKSLELLSSISIPVFVLIAIVAEPLVVLLIKEKWLPAVPYVKLFCIFGMLYPWAILNVQYIIAIGKTSIFLKITLIKQIFRILVLFFTFKHGVLYIVMGEVSVAVINQYINTIYTRKYLNYGFIKQIRTFVPYILISLIMGIIVYLLGRIGIVNMVIQLIVQSFAAMVIYVIINLLFKTNSYIEFQNLLFQFIANVKMRIEETRNKN